MKSKLLTALLSLAIAFGLWMYVITVVDPESEGSYYDVPVVFDGISQLDSRDMMITSGTSVTVDLRLLGNRTDLNKLDKTNITILADLSRITEPGQHNVKYSIFYPSSAGSIEVLNQDPQYITVQVSRRITKELPVRISYTGSMPENFIADVQNAVIDHNKVTVSGPEEVVNQMAYASITVDLNGRMDSIVETCRHALCDKDGNPIEDVSAVTVNVSTLQVTVKVYQIKELPLIIAVENGGGLTGQMVELTPEFTSILVSGSRADLENLDQIVLGPVKLGELAEDTQELLLNVVLPQNITNESGLTQVSVKVKMPEMQKRQFWISEFRVVGLPGGLIADVLASMLQVEIRGPAELMRQLETSMIVATVDCSNQEWRPNETNNLRLTITILGLEGVSPTRDYWVKVRVTEEGKVPEA